MDCASEHTIVLCSRIRAQHSYAQCKKSYLCDKNKVFMPNGVSEDMPAEDIIECPHR